MSSKALINEFLDKSNPIAIAGVSRNRKQFGRQVYDTLKNDGFQVLPVNNHAEKIGDEMCFKSIDSLPGSVKKLLIITPKEETEELVESAAKKGFKKIWIQQMSETEDAIKIAKEHNIDLIHGECIYMFAHPKGIHKVHRGINWLFGKLPK